MRMSRLMVFMRLSSVTLSTRDASVSFSSALPCANSGRVQQMDTCWISGLEIARSLSSRQNAIVGMSKISEPTQ